MKLKPFAELIKMSKEMVDAALEPIRVRKIKSQAETKMAEIDEKLLGMEEKLFSLCADKEIDFEQVLDLIDEIELLERRKNKYQEVLNQLFPPAN